MSSLVSVAEIRPRVSYRTIQVGTILFDEVPTGDEVVRIPGDGLALTTGDNEFSPLVRLEVWDGPAVHAESLWEYERTFDGTLLTQLAVVDLNGVTHGEITVPEGRSGTMDVHGRPPPSSKSLARRYVGRRGAGAGRGAVS